MEDTDKLEEFVERLISLLLKQGQSNFRAAQKAYGQSSFKVDAYVHVHVVVGCLRANYTFSQIMVFTQRNGVYLLCSL